MWGYLRRYGDCAVNFRRYGNCAVYFRRYGNCGAARARRPGLWADLVSRAAPPAAWERKRPGRDHGLFRGSSGISGVVPGSPELLRDTRNGSGRYPEWFRDTPNFSGIPGATPGCRDPGDGRFERGSRPNIHPAAVRAGQILPGGICHGLKAGGSSSSGRRPRPGRSGRGVSSSSGRRGGALEDDELLDGCNCGRAGRLGRCLGRRGCSGGALADGSSKVGAKPAPPARQLLRQTDQGKLLAPKPQGTLPPLGRPESSSSAASASPRRGRELGRGGGGPGGR